MIRKDDFRLTNYHSHTTRCMHAAGTEEEYVLQAIKSGFECLGFAEHTAWPYESDFVANMRMHISQLEDYVSTIRGLQEKYKDQIRIFLALECEGRMQALEGFCDEMTERIGTLEACLTSTEA